MMLASGTFSGVSGPREAPKRRIAWWLLCVPVAAAVSIALQLAERDTPRDVVDIMQRADAAVPAQSESREKPDAATVRIAPPRETGIR
jgi:hypothetical protein